MPQVCLPASPTIFQFWKRRCGISEQQEIENSPGIELKGEETILRSGTSGYCT
jgi:hypothetical protein